MKIEDREELVNINLALIHKAENQSLHLSKFKNISGTYLQNPNELINFLIIEDLIENESIENDGIYYLTENGYWFVEESYWTDYEAASIELERNQNNKKLNNRSIIHENSDPELGKHKNWSPKLTSIALKLLYFSISILVSLYLIQQSTDSSVPIYDMDLIELMKKL